jgi:uncharacterized protein YggE
LTDPIDERWIAVSAQGEEAVTPDLAVVTLAVSGTGKDLGRTRDDVNVRSSGVLARLREIGVAESDIQAPDVAIHPQYDYSKGQRLTGYRISRNLAVRVRDLLRLGEVLDGVAAAGANEVHGAQMTASDPSAAEHLALARAVDAARAKAVAIAAAAGVSLGPLMRLEEGDSGQPAPPTPILRAAHAEMAQVSTEIAPGELTVTSTVRAWFAIS